MPDQQHLILAILLNNQSSSFELNELRFVQKKQSAQDMTDEERKERVKNAPNLKACFTALSQEETLSGDDQWYCNICE